MKKKFALLALALGAIALAACEPASSSSVMSSSKPKSSSTPVSSSKVDLPKYTVTIKEDGKADVVSQIERGTALTKPADPVVPNGKRFYGWMNTKNGGQIWDFQNETLNQVMEDVELTPCFVDSSLTEQRFEAELCPDITAGTGMNGATYSGGAKGKQLIYRDWPAEEGLPAEYGSTSVTSFQYNSYVDNETLEEGYCEIGEESKIPQGCTNTVKTVNVEYGSFVHFMYEKNDTLTWEVYSDVAATNVTLFARYSAEYGVSDGVFDELKSTVTETSYPITVNGTALQYGKVTLHNTPNIGQFLPCQDYMVSATVNLVAGKNTIQMKVNNEDTLNGTISSSAPCVDSIKLYSSSTLTWPGARYTNLIID